MAAAAAASALASAGPVSLDASATRVVIAPTPALAQAGRAPLALMLSGLSTDRQPGVLYQVAIAGDGPPRSLGYINFYNAASASAPGFVFPLGVGFDASRGLTVVVTPAKPPDPQAHPRIGLVAVVYQPRP
jgi:hypothetical protein